MPEFQEQTPVNAGLLHKQFAMSWDGCRGTRCDHRLFGPRGMRGEFDEVSERLIYGVALETSGRGMFMFHHTSRWSHSWDRNKKNQRLLTQAKLEAGKNIAATSAGW